MEDKTYEQIAKELQQQINERKEAERYAAMKMTVSAELIKLGYKDDNHNNALAVLEPFISSYEDAEEAKEQTLKLHHAVHGVSERKKANSIFK